MARIVIANVGAHGHVNPTLGVVRALRGAGHEITYCSTEAFRQAVEFAGARFVAYESSLGRDRTLGQSMSRRTEFFSLELYREALHVLPQIENVLRTVEPDLLIYDRLCVAGRLLADRMNMLAASFYSSYAANAQFSVRQRYPLQPSSRPEAELEWQELRRSFCTRHGIELAEAGSMMLRAAPLNIVFLPRAFQIAGHTFDDRFVFVGPCLSPRTDAGSWSPPNDGARKAAKRLLISLGTLFNHRPEFFRLCIEAFADSDWEVAMSIGQTVDVNCLGEVLGNILIRRHLPMLDILPHVQVFIGHAGMNSTMEALYHGVPLIVVPQMPEQRVTAERVVELSLGRKIEMEGLSAAELRRLVEETSVDVKVRASVRAMRQRIEQSGGAERAARAIDAYLCARASKLAVATP